MTASPALPAALTAALPRHDGTPVSDLWLLWANDKGGWWIRNDHGYTRCDRLARRFTTEQAAAQVASSGAFCDGTPQLSAVRAPNGMVPAPIELPYETVHETAEVLRQLIAAGDVTDGDQLFARAVVLDQGYRALLREATR